MSVRKRLEAEAADWDDEGRPEAMLVTNDRQLMLLVCWAYSPGGQSEGLSPVLADYVAASRRTKPSGWEDQIYAEKDNCARCGETYRKENLQFCTNCFCGFCYQCVDRFPVSRNGNRAHTCGGEIVG